MEIRTYKVFKYNELTEDQKEKVLERYLEDYRIILQKEFDYRTSRESIEESLIANDYDFTEDGKID